MPAPTYVNSASTAVNDGSSISISSITGHQDGDVAIAVFSIPSQQGFYPDIITDGWVRLRGITNVTGNFTMVIYYKRVTAKDALSNFGMSIDYTASGPSDSTLIISVYRGVDVARLIDVENGQTTAAGTSHSTPSVTTNFSDTMLVAAFAVEVESTTTWTPPSGMTERRDVSENLISSSLADVVQTSAGSTGAKTATSSTTGDGIAAIIALIPTQGSLPASGFRSAWWGDNTGSNSIIAERPGGTQGGDLLLAFVTRRNDTPAAITTPVGWKMIRETVDDAADMRVAVLFRRTSMDIANEDDDWTFVFAADSGTNGHAVAIVAYDGIFMVQPVDVEGVKADTTASTTHDTPDLTTTVANAVLVGCWNAAVVSRTWTPPAGFTERLDSDPPDSGSMLIADAVQASAGATGTKTATHSGAAALGMSQMVVLKPFLAPASGIYERSIFEEQGVFSGSNLPIRKPADAAPGDVLILQIVGTNSSPPTITPASGWTQIRSDAQSTNVRSVLFYHVVGLSDPNSWTFVFSASASPTRYKVSCFVRVSNSSPIDVSGGQGNATSTSVTAPTVTTTQNNTLLIYFGSTSTGIATFDPPSGMAETADFAFTSVSYSWEEATEARPTAGATGTRVGTISATSPNVGQLVALAPHLAPVAPALVDPVGGVVQDLASGYLFDWTFSDAGYVGATQAEWQLRRKIGAGAYEYWRTSDDTWQSTPQNNSGAVSSENFPSGKWTNGNTYNWSVAVKDSMGANFGPFASDAVVTAGTPPSVTVLTPADPSGDSRPLVTWSFSDPESNPQSTYHVKIFTQAQYSAGGFDPGTSTPTINSTELSGANTSYPLTTDLIHNTTYRAYVRVKDSSGQYSPWSYKQFLVSFDAPATPSIVATGESDNARIKLDLQSKDNLLSDNEASIETDSAGWAVDSNCTLARDTSNAVKGSASLQLTASSAADMRAKVATKRAVKVGLTYTGVASFKKASAGSRSVRCLLRWYDSGNTLLSTTTGSSVTADETGFTQATVQGVAPANADKVELVVEVLAPANAEVWYMDAAGVVPGTSTSWARGGVAGAATHKIIVEYSDDAGATWQEISGSPFAPDVYQQAIVYDYESVPTKTRQYRAKTTVVV